MGRPSSFKNEYTEQAAKLCRLGAIDTDLADFFGVHIDTVHEWKKRHSAFSDALKDAKEQVDAVVERSLYERARGYSFPSVKIVADVKSGQVLKVPFTEHCPPDVTACIFWLKNRRPKDWREKQEHTLTGPDGGPIKTEEVVFYLPSNARDKVIDSIDVKPNTNPTKTKG